MTNKRIIALLSRPEHFEAALELEPLISEARDIVFRLFWDRVAEEIQNRLKKGNYRWQMKRSTNVNDAFSILGLVDSDSKAPHCNEPDSKVCRYSFMFESLTGRREDVYYGIYRGREVKSPTDSDRELVKELELLRFKEDPWWVGWSFIAKRGYSLPFRSTSDDGSVLLLNEDNNKDGHPLAINVAHLLWDIFERFHTKVEKLNDNWPYDYVAERLRRLEELRRANRISEAEYQESRKKILEGL